MSIMLIDEIIDLPLNLETPINLEWFNIYNLNDIAKSLVQRLHLNFEDKKESINHKGKIHLKFHPSIIPTLCLTREFKNGHQTHSSSGVWDIRRSSTESLLLHAPFDTFESKQLIYRDHDSLHRLRPKYAMYVPSPLEGSSMTYQLFSILSNQYGLISAVLNDDIKERSTYTIIDSLCSTKDRANTFYHDMNETPYEVQIYGSIKISTDVDYFIVNPLLKMFYSKEIILLKSLGKVVK